MRYRQVRWLMTTGVAVVCMAAAGVALARPFSPSVADIQGLSDQTQGFHGAPGQLSTIDEIQYSEDGIHLTVTYRVGNSAGCDPFLGCQEGEVVGLDFPRVSLALYTNGENPVPNPMPPPDFVGTGRDLTPFDGIKWCIMSDQPLFGQPFLQTAPNWTFYEPNGGGQNVAGDMSLQMLLLDFNNAVNFSGLQPPNIVHPDGNGEIRANAMGLQLIGPGTVTASNPVVAHVWISRWVPEPSSVALLGLGVLGLAGMARRRS